MIIMIILGILLKFIPSADTTAISLSPTTLLYPLVSGLQYGKLTLEFKKNSTSSYLAQISGTYLRKHKFEKDYIMFGSNDSSETNFEKYQISGFIGKRYFYRHIIYLQPTLSLGYSRDHNYLAPSKSSNGTFSSVLIYSGLRLGNDCVFDFNIGAGYDLFGKQSYEYLAPFNVDANFSIGYEF